MLPGTIPGATIPGAWADQPASPRPLPERVFAGYYALWLAERDDRAEGGPIDPVLASLPDYVNVVILAFMKPDGTYRGGRDLAGTGLEHPFDQGTLPYDGLTLDRSLQALRRRRPNTVVLLSVGGWTYQNFDALNVDAVVRVVRDFGLDGVDIDFEPHQSACAPQPPPEGRITCPTDPAFISVMRRFREALPRPHILTVAGWPNGAYGEGRWRDARPRTGYTGLMLGLLRSPAAADIDMINIMAYGVNRDFDPAQALEAYRNVFPGALTLGAVVPPETDFDLNYSLEEVRRLASVAMAGNARGMMLFALGQDPTRLGLPRNEGQPNDVMIAQTICTSLGLPACNQPVRRYD